MPRKIFEIAKLGDLNLRNRLVRSATWEGLADEEGHLFEEAYQTYEELATGELGAVITGFTTVSDTDHQFGGMARLSNDSLIPEHERLVGILHTTETPVLTQLALGEYVRPGEQVPRNIDSMTIEDIHTVKDWFVDAAIRAGKAGYDGVQVHSAHGFFLSRFISPGYNHRSDEYGGSVLGRAQLLLEIIEEIRRVLPSIHLTMKINSNDFIPGGLTPEMSMEICLAATDAGLGSIEVSGNGTSVAGIKPGVNEAYFKDFALALADKVDIPVILVGGLRSLPVMEEVLNESDIEFLSLSRPLIREPHLAKRWHDGDTSPALCISCNACYQTPGHKCIFNLRKQA